MIKQKIIITRKTAKEIIILMSVLKVVSNVKSHKKRADKIYNQLHKEIFNLRKMKGGLKK